MTNVINIATRRGIEGRAEDEHIDTGSQMILEELLEDVNAGEINSIAAIAFDRTTKSYRYHVTEEIVDATDQRPVFRLIAALDRLRHLLQCRLDEGMNV